VAKGLRNEWRRAGQRLGAVRRESDLRRTQLAHDGAEKGSSMPNPIGTGVTIHQSLVTHILIGRAAIKNASNSLAVTTKSLSNRS